MSSGQRDFTINCGSKPQPVIHALLLRLGHVPTNITPFLIQEYAQLLQQYLLIVDQNYCSKFGEYAEVISQLVCVAISQTLLDVFPQVDVNCLESMMVRMVILDSAPWWKKWFYTHIVRGQGCYSSQLWDCWKADKDDLRKAAADAYAHLTQVADQILEHQREPSHSQCQMPDSNLNASRSSPVAPTIHFEIRLFERASVTMNGSAVINNTISQPHSPQF
ncbi:hypothetical protein AX16_006098 [Volvariella volvacea WC 439]|nr:hypothetical protein AX16_006098 [Volvariella volvacea WC 439]